MNLAGLKKVFNRNTLLIWIVIGCLGLTVVAGVAVWVMGQGAERDQYLYQRGITYQQAGRTEEAIASLREAVELNPDNLDARIALIRAYNDRNEHEQAFGEIGALEGAGAEEHVADLLRVQVHRSRALYRLRSAGLNVTPEVCSAIIEEEIQPALELLETPPETSEDAAPWFMELGNLHELNAGILYRQGRALEEARRTDLQLRRVEDAEEKRVAILETARSFRLALSAARDAFSQAIESDPHWAEPRLALARQHLESPDPDAETALDILEPVPQNDPGYAQALLLRAVAERHMGNDESALELLQLVPEDSPYKSRANLEEADILVENEDYDKAAPLTEELVRVPWSRFNQKGRVEYLRARILDRQGNLGEAISRLQNVFTAFEHAEQTEPWPDAPEARLLLAEMRMRDNKSAQALDTYRDVVSDVERLLPLLAPGARERRADLRDMKYEACTVLAAQLKDSVSGEAADYAEEALSLYPARSEAYELARQTAQQVERRKDLTDLIIIHARGLRQEGKLDQAIQLCRSERQQADEKARVDLFLASCLVMRGDLAEATGLYEEILDRQLLRTDRTAVQMELAGLLWRQNRLEDAADVYQDILDDGRGDAVVVRALAEVLFRRGKSDKATELLLRGLEAHRADPQMRQLGGPLLMDHYLRQRNYDAAVDFLKSEIEAHPEDPRLLVAAAVLSWAKEDLDAARGYFNKALERDAPVPSAYNRVYLDLSEGKYAQARDLCEEALEKMPLAGVLNIPLAVAHQGLGEHDRAVIVLRDAVRNEDVQAQVAMEAKLMAEVVLAALGGLAPDALENNGGVDVAEPVELNDAVDEERKRFLSALSELEDAERREAALAFNLMMVMTRAGRLREARRAAESVQSCVPDEPLPTCMTAALLVRLGLFNEARAAYDEVITKHPRYTTAWFGKARSFMLDGKHAEAADALEETLNLDLTDSQQARVLLSLGAQYQRSDQLDKAEDAYLSATQYRDAAPLAYNDLAWLLAVEKGEPASALPYARMAVDLLPDAPPIADTLGWIQFLLGDYREAVVNLDRAVRGMPGNPTVRFHLGKAYLAVGQKEKALEEMRAALAMGRPFEHEVEARKLIEEQ